MGVKKQLGSLVHKCFCIIKLPAQKQYYSSECYFPEMADHRKSKFTILLDQCKNIIKYGEPNKFYFLYGLDIKDYHKSEDFVDYTLFMRRRNAMNFSFIWYPPVAVLRDKALFGIVAEAYGINVPKNYGVIKKEEIYLFDEKASVPIQSFLNNHLLTGEVFIKKLNGECADGVFKAIIKDGQFWMDSEIVDLKSFLRNDESYLLQSAITNQHSAIKAIYGKAINTLRLVTVHNKKTDEIEVLSCVLRVGKGNSVVDNWAAGGLSIGVDTERGTLRKFGFYKPGYGTKVTEHPDSHIKFEGYQIPFMQEAIAQAKELHRHLYGLHSIGWDIAITTEGPCFVEGNDDWEISLMQISNHGLKREFDRLFY